MGTTLTIIFVVLKLVGVISFSWFYVFLPIIIELALAIMWPLIVAFWVKVSAWATSEDF